MTRTTRLRRISAAALTLTIVAAGLALAPVGSASAASDTHNAAIVLDKLDAYRTAKGIAKFKRNTTLSAYAQDVARYYAGHGSTTGFSPSDTNPKPEGAADSQSFLFKISGSATAATTKIAKKHRDFSLSIDDGAFLFDPTLNYAAVGFVKKDKYTYAFLLENRYDKPLQTTVQPSISGKRAVGSTVKATFSGWSPTPTAPKFQWYANGSALSGETSSTFTIGSGSLGKTLYVRVTSSPSNYTSSERYSNETKAVERGTIAAKTPTVSGTRLAKQTLTANAGNWGSGVTLKYQWLRNGSAISDASEATYKVRSADVGKRVDVRVTGSRAGFTTATKTTATTAKVLHQFVTVKPVVSGSGQSAGTVLMAKVGTWTPAASEYKYRWKRDGANISKATGKTYRTTSADVGHTLTVTVTGSKTGYLSVAVASAGRPLGVG